MNVTSLKNLKNGTNINQIDIPPELEETVNMGIPFMNDAFGGEGITPSMSILFTGTPGAGKTTLMLQTANASTKKDHIILYNTTEESLFQVRKVVKRLNLKEGFIVGQDRLVPDVLKHADFLRKENPGKKLIMIIDSLQTHDDGFYSNGATNGATPVRVAGMITEYCKKHYAMAFMVGMVNKDGHFSGRQALKHMIDAHAHLFIDQRPSSDNFGKRILRIEKNRFGCSGIGYILGMSGSKGLYEVGSYGGDEVKE